MLEWDPERNNLNTNHKWNLTKRGDRLLIAFIIIVVFGSYIADSLIR